MVTRFRFILTTSKDLSAKIWSVDSEEKNLAATTFNGHRDYVMGAFFSHDQEKIYTVSKDGAVFVWEFTKRPSDDDDNESEDEDKQEEVDISKYSWRITKKHFFTQTKPK